MIKESEGGKNKRADAVGKKTMNDVGTGRNKKKRFGTSMSAKGVREAE